jgi:hypothetical protein
MIFVAMTYVYLLSNEKNQSQITIISSYAIIASCLAFSVFILLGIKLKSQTRLFFSLGLISMGGVILSQFIIDEELMYLVVTLVVLFSGFWLFYVPNILAKSALKSANLDMVFTYNFYPDELETKVNGTNFKQEMKIGYDKFVKVYETNYNYFIQLDNKRYLLLTKKGFESNKGEQVMNHLITKSVIIEKYL